VVLAAWDRRRAWINGGDRAVPWDRFCYTSGATVRAHLVVSHFGRSRGKAKLSWTVQHDDGKQIAGGEAESNFDLAPGELREITVAEFKLPAIGQPRRATLRAAVTVGDDRSENSWPLWFFPRDVWKDVTDVALLDPANRLSGLPMLPDRLVDGQITIATTWTNQLDRFLSRGGRAVLLQSSKQPGPVPILEMPFWREAIRLIERDHPAWQDFPIGDGFAGLQFFGLATDCALDTSRLSMKHRPILRRLDARIMRLHDYATEIEWQGGGRLIISTLRFEGSLGIGNSAQPLGIDRNVAAGHLLRRWVTYLQSQ
jgi:hypothetical protein